MIRVLILRDYFGITAPTQLNPLHWEDPNSSNKRDSTSSYPTKKNKCPGVRKIFNKVENNQHEGSEMKGEFHNGQTMKGFVMSVHLLIKTVLKIRSDCISISITYIYLKKKTNFLYFIRSRVYLQQHEIFFLGKHWQASCLS